AGPRTGGSCVTSPESSTSGAEHTSVTRAHREAPPRAPTPQRGGPRPPPSPQRKEPTMRNGSNGPSHLRSSSPPPSTVPGRRAFVAGALAVAGLTATGCGPSNGLVSGNTRLREWNLFAGGDGLRLMEMHEGYRSNHPDVDFSATTFG